ncbi:carbohydrate kinase family protein [Mumia sp. ZJ1417]|uniref:carbohydrate kinase family protein n=2 Tax=Mumia TaxID=1546255 RepID=UPI001422D465|nr:MULTISPECIES: carbohydrate kinase family protein [unclassified Mumia]QMW67711.1 carbohydrate kinase family protein [Mumia sp. ZJ1417]
MKIAVSGSIANDHLMTFTGKFSDSLVVDQLDKISLSFLVDDLVVRRGGCGANIAFGLAALGEDPVLIGAVGEDFDDYRSWLERHGVDCSGVHVSETRHTARFVCTTDAAQAQIATFYAGAMAEAREIELKPIHDRVGGWDIVLIGPDDPEGMVRHTEECRTRGYRFAADPSQQLAFADGALIRTLIDGATYLFSNEYEAALTEKKTGWSAGEIQQRVGTRVVTRGADGVSVYEADGTVIDVPAIAGINAVDPTGVGDAFRAGFLAGLGVDLPHEQCAQLGCALAASVVETTGTQEYRLERHALLARIRSEYGAAAADIVDERLPSF